MSTTNNTNANNNGSALNSEDIIAIKADPVKWATKNNKLVFGNVADLHPDALLNIRHRAGTVVHGVKVTHDTYDLPQMDAGIVEMVGIQEPIWVSVRKDGTKVPLRGNRRTYSGQGLLANPQISVELRDALTKKTPMILLHGLTHAQERELIQDQNQLEFMYSEVVKHVFALRAEKRSFADIALNNWQLIGKLRNNKKKLAEMRSISDLKAREEKIKGWLRGTLDCYLLWGYDLGEFVRKCIIQSEMFVDGLIGENDEKAYFDTTVKSQKRIAALKEARKQDGTKWNGTVKSPDSEFWKLIESFHNEDFGIKTGTEPVKPPKMMQRKDLEGIKDTFSSRAVRAMVARVLGEEVPDLNERDEFAASMETKLMLVEQYLPRVNPEVAGLLRLMFVNPDAVDFQDYLESNLSEEAKTEGEEPKTESETPPAEGEVPTEDEGNEFSLDDAV